MIALYSLLIALALMLLVAAAAAVRFSYSENIKRDLRLKDDPCKRGYHKDVKAYIASSDKRSREKARSKVYHRRFSS